MKSDHQNVLANMLNSSKSVHPPFRCFHGVLPWSCTMCSINTINRYLSTSTMSGVPNDTRLNKTIEKLCHIVHLMAQWCQYRTPHGWVVPITYTSWSIMCSKAKNLCHGWCVTWVPIETYCDHEIQILHNLTPNP